MKTFRSKAMAAFGLGLLAVSGSAAADSSPTDKSTATELFKEGRALLDQGRVSEACRKLEESQRLDPGGGTLLNVALCHEREGRTATAWVEFTEALGIAKKDDRSQRVEFARAHIAQLEPALSRLVIEVPGAADLPDLEIKRDGSVVPRAAWGSPVPIDPGDHVIEAGAPGKIAWKQSVVVGPRPETKTLNVPRLDESPEPDEKTPAAAPEPSNQAFAPKRTPGSESPNRPIPTERPAGSSPGLMPYAWASIAVGVAATGVGTYLALHAISLKNDADRNCPNNACNALGAARTSDAIRSANFATLGFGVGVLGLGLGVVLFAIHPAARSREAAGMADRASVAVTGGDVSVGPHGGELSVSGRF